MSCSGINGEESPRDFRLLAENTRQSSHSPLAKPGVWLHHLRAIYFTPCCMSLDRFTKIKAFKYPRCEYTFGASSRSRQDLRG
jgi:hypothetical protein